MECTNCHAVAVAVWQPPCNMDPVLDQQGQVITAPLKSGPDQRNVLEMAKYFRINAVQMRARLKEGISIETSSEQIAELAGVFEKNGVPYKIVKPEDPRNRYPYFRHCGLKRSKMRRYLEK